MWVPEGSTRQNPSVPPEMHRTEVGVVLQIHGPLLVFVDKLLRSSLGEPQLGQDLPTAGQKPAGVSSPAPEVQILRRARSPWVGAPGCALGTRWCGAPRALGERSSLPLRQLLVLREEEPGHLPPAVRGRPVPDVQGKSRRAGAEQEAAVGARGSSCTAGMGRGGESILDPVPTTGLSLCMLSSLLPTCFGCCP